MKKLFHCLLFSLLTIMSLTACGSTNTGEIDELRQQVKALETRISELENSAKWHNSTEEKSEITESSANSNWQISEHFDALTEHDRPAIFLEIAKCDFANEAHLLEVAKNCITGYYSERKQFELASALSENSATTDAVMAKLVDSKYPEVVSIVHEWMKP